MDITPQAGHMPDGVEGVLDHPFVRAIIIGNDKTSGALTTVDTIGLSSDIWANISSRASKELEIPADHILLSATHTDAIPPYTGQVFETLVIPAIREAKSKAQPARVSYGTDISYINVNRSIIDPAPHRWWEGPNCEGPSDKTLAVVRFTALSDKPIAVYYNYAVHPA